MRLYTVGVVILQPVFVMAIKWLLYLQYDSETIHFLLIHYLYDPIILFQQSSDK